MKTLSKVFLFASLFCLTLNLSAQEESPQVYYQFDYMKVESGMHDKYLETEKAWKKIHTAKKAAGQIENWTLMEIVSPYGANTEYNYVTRIRFSGDAQLAAHYDNAFMPKDWKSLLTAEELELVKNTAKTRTLVKSETIAAMDRVFSEDMKNANLAVVNFFDFPEGKTRSDHVAIERDIWMPVHKARIDSGKLKGWVLGQIVMPAGSGMPYHDITVDIYENFAHMLNDNPMPYFEKVHMGKRRADLLDKTSKNTDLVKREIRREVDSL